MNEEYLIVKNPDKKFVAGVVEKIIANAGYCISKFERTQDTRCHCKVFKETGECACGLFIKVPCVEIKGE